MAGSALLHGTTGSIELGAQSRFLPSAYEAGNIAAIRYDLSTLPPTASLSDDISRFAELYGRCVEIKDELAANRLLRTSARSADRRAIKSVPRPEFKPKDADDYIAHVGAATQRRSRRHEALVRAFGEQVLTTGRSASTNVHPRDLVVLDGEIEWLVEAKTVGINAELNVRAAIGQLFAYRHFYYRQYSLPDPTLLALFDGLIGAAFEGLLSSLGIAFLCRNGSEWHGTGEAVALVI